MPWRSSRKLLAFAMATGAVASCSGTLIAGGRPDALAGRASPALLTQAPPTSSIYFLLLDSTLKEERIELLGLRSGEISFRDEAGRTRTAPLDDVAALLPSWWGPRGQIQEIASGYSPGASTKPLPTKEGSGFIELTDGQRIGVGLVTDPDDAAPSSPDAVLWETGGGSGTGGAGSGGFGTLSVQLDTVRRIRFAPPPTSKSAATGLWRLPQGIADVLARSAPQQSRVRATMAPDPIDKADRVLLINGDSLSGFVERIGPVVTIEAGGRTVDTPVQQVAEIRLLNEARAPKGTRLWLSGGIVIDAARLSAEGPRTAAAKADAVRVELSADVWKQAPESNPSETPSRVTETDGGTRLPPPPSPTAAEAGQGKSGAPSALFNIPRILAIVPHVESLVSLASLPVIRQLATEDRPRFEPLRLSWFGVPLGADDSRETMLTSTRAESEGSGGSPMAVQPPMDAADIELPGPMLVEWSIPTAATRVAGWAELPRECWTWGHCIIVMTLAPSDGASTPASTELLRETLSREHPIAEFSIAIDASPLPVNDRVLRVEVLSGERGPIQDRVLLRRVLLMCKPGVSK